MALEVSMHIDLSESLGKLETLKMFAPNFAMEAMQKSGTKLRKKMISKANSYGSHDWGKTNHNGHQRVTFGRGSKKAYSREGKNVSGKNENLAEFVRMQGYDKTLKVLVGFMNEKKGFRAYSYNNGEKTSYSKVSGVFTKEIGQRMEYGGRQSLSDKQKAMFRYSGMEHIANRGYVKRIARPIVRPAYNAIKGTIMSDISKSYKKAFYSAIQNSQRKVS